jgi:hypothetical protein
LEFRNQSLKLVDGRKADGLPMPMPLSRRTQLQEKKSDQMAMGTGKTSRTIGNMLPLRL